MRVFFSFANKEKYRFIILLLLTWFNESAFSYTANPIWKLNSRSKYFEEAGHVLQVSNEIAPTPVTNLFTDYKM